MKRNIRDVLDGPLVSLQCNGINNALSEMIDVLKHHETLIKKVPTIIDTSIAIQEDIAFLKTALSNTSKENVLIDKCYCTTTSIATGEETKSNESVHEAKFLPYQSIDKVFRDLSKLKSSFEELRQSHESTAAVTRVTHSQISLLRAEALETQRELALSATSKQMQSIKQDVERYQNTIKHHLDSLEENIKSDIDQREKRSFLSLRQHIKSNEELANKKHNAIESNLSSYAKKSDLDTIDADFSIETTSLKRQLTSIIDSIRDLKRAIKVKDEQNATITLHRIQCMCSRRILECTWRCWNQFLIEERSKQRSTLTKKRFIHRMITQSLNGNLEKSFKKWIHCKNSINLQRKHLNKLCRVTKSLILDKERDAFILWNRFLIISKESGHNDDYTDSTLLTSSNHLSEIEGLKTAINSQKDSLTRMNNLGQVMIELSNDTEGKFNIIVNELKHLQNVDMQLLRNSLASTGENFQKQLENEIKMCFNSLDGNIKDLAIDFHTEMNTLQGMFPTIESQQNEFASTLSNTMEQMKENNLSTKARMTTLSGKLDVVDSRIQDLEAHLIQSNKQIRDLIEQGEKSAELIRQLTSRLDESEQAHKETKQIYSDMMRCMQQDIRDLQFSTSSHSNEIDSIQLSLSRVINCFDNHETENLRDLRQINSRLDALGLEKPRLDIVVNNCIYYEELAAEKNYAFPLNSATNDAKSINLPVDIANFAHDYSAWISYQADHEALQRIAVGLIPDDMVFVDEDTNSRRHELLESLKSDMINALEKIHPNPGASRMEARTKYITKLMDTADAALSKHEQIIVSSDPTRIGRTRLPTCVACDRPLRNKARQRVQQLNHSFEEPGNDVNRKVDKQRKSTEGHRNSNSQLNAIAFEASGRSKRASQSNEEHNQSVQQHAPTYIKRAGGFRMKLHSQKE